MGIIGWSIIVYIMGGVVAFFTVANFIEPINSREWWQVWTSVILWPLALVLGVAVNLPSVILSLMPERGAVTLSRKQQKSLLYEDEKNKRAREAVQIQEQYNAALDKTRMPL